MKCSLSEIGALAQKAACGAGMYWGLSEEAGRAVRWLEACELPGLAVLVELLTLNDGKPYYDLAPVTLAGIWQAPGGDLCPLVAGTVLCDQAKQLKKESTLELAGTAYPLLLLPFTARLAELLNSPVTLRWSDFKIYCMQTGVVIIGSENLSASRSERVVISQSPNVLEQDGQVKKHARTGAVSVSASVWQRLEIFAHRTYVPASESSRQSGAGAGRIDKD